MRRGFAGGVLIAVVLAALFGTQARWLYMSLAVGSPHHIAGEANRSMGEALQGIVPAGEPVMSWHPAIALYARRDWRVLPHAGFDDIVRYAGAIDTRYVVISQYYPGPRLIEDTTRIHLVLHVPPEAASATRWNLTVADGGRTHFFGTLEAAPEPIALAQPVEHTQE